MCLCHVGKIDDADAFVKAYSVMLKDIKDCKEKAKKGAQAKLNASRSGPDARLGMFEAISTQQGATEFGHAAVPKAFEHESAGPLVLTATVHEASAIARQEGTAQQGGTGRTAQQEGTAQPVPVSVAAASKAVCCCCLVANGLRAQGVENVLALTTDGCIDASVPHLPYLVPNDPLHNRKLCPNDVRKSRNLSPEENKKLANLHSNFSKGLRRRGLVD